MDNDVRIIISEIISFSKEAKSIIKTFHDWYNENKMIIQSVIVAVSELGTWVKAVELMRDHQFIFTDDLSIALSASKHSNARSIPLSMSVNRIVPAKNFATRHSLTLL